jgi:hypothetical protein
MTSSQAIVRVKSDINRYAKESAWLRTWLAIEASPWRALAIIPTHAGSSLEAVHALAAVAWEQRGPSVIVADIRTISLHALSTVREELRQRTARGERILIASRSLDENPVAATIAREADGVVLCVVLGRTTRKSVAQAIKEIGKDRIIGTISLRLHVA